MKNKIKLIVSSIVFLILVICCFSVLNYLLSDDVSSLPRLKMHEIYTMEENIDSLFVGPSHCNRSINPFVVGSTMEENAFNGATNLQLTDASLAVIKETNKHHNLKKVFVEISISISTAQEQKERTELTPVYRISDFMKPSIDKVRFLLEASSSEYYGNSFIIAKRNNMKIFDKDFITNQIIKKSSEAYKNYDFIEILNIDPIYKRRYKEKYIGNGYSESYGVLPTGSNCLEKNRFSQATTLKSISNDFKNNLIKIIDYCKENDIKVVFFVSPVQDFCLYYENYDEFTRQIKEILHPYMVEFYDFNICKPEYFNLEDKHFSDPNHTNNEGAKIFSEVLSNVMIGKYKKEIFYSSYEEKIKSMEPTVFGLSFEKKEGEIQIDILKNFKEDVQVNIEKYTRDNEVEKREYKTSDKLIIKHSNEEHGKVKVNVFYKGVKVNNSWINY